MQRRCDSKTITIVHLGLKGLDIYKTSPSSLFCAGGCVAERVLTAEEQERQPWGKLPLPCRLVSFFPLFSCFSAWFSFLISDLLSSEIVKRSDGFSRFGYFIMCHESSMDRHIHLKAAYYSRKLLFSSDLFISVFLFLRFSSSITCSLEVGCDIQPFCLL